MKTPHRNPRHICFVAPDAYPILAGKNFGACGGAETQQVLIAKALMEHGYKTTFVVRDYGQQQREVHDGIDTWRCPFRYLGGSNWHFPVDTLAFMRILRLINSNFYLLKGPRTLLFPMGLYHRLYGGKLLKLMASDRECGPQPDGLMSRLYLWGLRFVDHVVFQTEHQAEIAKRYLGLNGRVIPNIAHCESFPTNSRQRDIDVLWVGMIRPEKRPEVLLDIAETMPDVTFDVIAADGPDNEKNRSITRRAKCLGNVRWRGFVPYRNIAQYYRRAKVLLSTSDREGFPNTFLQAWQTGTPVVSLMIDPDNIIKRHRLGRVSGKIQRGIEDIRNLLRNSDLREELGRRGKHYVDHVHNAGIIVQRYVETFETLLGRGRAA